MVCEKIGSSPNRRLSILEGLEESPVPGPHEAKHERASSNMSDPQGSSTRPSTTSAPLPKHIKLSGPLSTNALDSGMLRPRTEIETNLLQLIGGTQSIKETQLQPTVADSSTHNAENIIVDAELEDLDGERPRELSAKQKKKLARFTEKIEREAGEVLHTVELDSITPIPEEVKWKEDPELLCCYNWQETQEGSNTIFVPGGPPKWTPQAIPHALEKDDGWSYTDYNYVRSPKDPYSAMFHALGAMNSEYQFMDTDVIADRNNLRVLLEFTQGKHNGPFRLNLYTVYNTLIITRRESKYWMNMGGNPSQASLRLQLRKGIHNRWRRDGRCNIALPCN